MIVDNPEIELALDDLAADAVPVYRFDAKAGEQVLRLLADRRYMRVHRGDD